MMRILYGFMIVVFCGTPGVSIEPNSLWSHLHRSSELCPCRDVDATIHQDDDSKWLSLSVSKLNSYAWICIPPPQEGWQLERYATVEADLVNVGSMTIDVLLWVVGDLGWDAVPSQVTLEPGQSKSMSCHLRETYPDGTPKIDPSRIRYVQVMLTKPTTTKKTLDGDLRSNLVPDIKIQMRNLRRTGNATAWQQPIDRVLVPNVEDALPQPGHRVRYQLVDDALSGIYGVLNLPDDWQPDRKYPVIMEYPGNRLYTKDCYSTGMPDQCVIGYGMTQGRGAICVGLPLIDRQSGGIMEYGWGNVDQTCQHAIKFVDEICEKFGGDRENVVMTGFSRGAIACGYLGLRNDEIAKLWKGFHALQHYDGHGWGGSTMAEALQRSRRFSGKAVFHTDNSRDLYQPIMEAMGTSVTWADSRLGAHATAMVLDNRPSTLQLRAWFRDLVKD